MSVSVRLCSGVQIRLRIGNDRHAILNPSLRDVDGPLCVSRAEGRAGDYDGRYDRQSAAGLVRPRPKDQGGRTGAVGQPFLELNRIAWHDAPP